MNMFARFDKNPAMTLQDIKETKRYVQTHGRTHGQRENSIPTTNKVISVLFMLCFRALLFIDALWSPAGKGLTSWFSPVMSL